MFFSRLGYTAESTTNPLEALEMVKTDIDKFDLVIFPYWEAGKMTGSFFMQQQTQDL